MVEKGKIAVKQVKKGKEYAVMLSSKKGKQYKKIVFDYEFDDSLNSKDCEVEIIDNKIIKIVVDGQALSKKKGTDEAKRTKEQEKQSRRPVPYDDSLDYSKTLLPDDTKALKFNKIDNFHLKLNKVARFENGKFVFFKTDRGKIQFKINPYYGDFNFLDFCDRHAANLQKLEQSNITIESAQFQPIWRLVVGLGNESVYETSMTLHHIYGFPYIPGSTIKGSVRSMVINNFFNKCEGNRTVGALSDGGFCQIFGSPADSIIGEHSGSVIFFDAYPLKAPKIEPDVLNPHYTPYYSDDSGKIPPADYHNPVPVFFLTVVDTPFAFHLGTKVKNNMKIENGQFKDQVPIQLTLNWLKNTLSEYGMGAKTAVGYGYMNEL